MKQTKLYQRHVLNLTEMLPAFDETNKAVPTACPNLTEMLPVFSWNQHHILNLQNYRKRRPDTATKVTIKVMKTKPQMCVRVGGGSSTSCTSWAFIFRKEQQTQVQRSWYKCRTYKDSNRARKVHCCKRSRCQGHAQNGLETPNFKLNKWY